MTVEAAPVYNPSRECAITRTEYIRVSGIVNQSIVDGPGLRMAVFAQGCPHHCAGCHNPSTHGFAGGFEISADEILSRFDDDPLLAGMTLSGGEPLAQAGRLLPLAEAVKLRNKNVWCYTGYTFEELLARCAKDWALRPLLDLVDVLVDGRYEASLRDLTLPYRGSANQRILDMQASLRTGRAVIRK